MCETNQNGTSLYMAIGTRVVTVESSDSVDAVPAGIRGTVACVNNQIKVKLDNGSILDLIADRHCLRKLSLNEQRDEISNELFEKIELSECSALFTPRRYDSLAAPEGLHCYYLNDTPERNFNESVFYWPMDRFSGTIFTPIPLYFENPLPKFFGDGKEPSYTNQKISVRNFLIQENEN